MPKQFGTINNKHWVRWGKKGKKYFYKTNNKHSLNKALIKVNKQRAAIWFSKKEK